MDNDFRKPQQAGDLPHPPAKPHSNWQNDVISALHSSSAHKLAVPDSVPAPAEHAAVKVDSVPAADAGHMYIQPRHAENAPQLDSVAPATDSNTSGRVVSPVTESHQPSAKPDYPVVEQKFASLSAERTVTEPVGNTYFSAVPKTSHVNSQRSYPSITSFISPDSSNTSHDNSLPTADDDHEIMPIAVVQVVSTRGVEYAMMTLALWLGASSLLGVMLSLINGGTSPAVLAFPASVLLVCLPVFSFFFLRLKKAELLNPELKVDPSKRRLTQFTQLVAFATCLFTLIAFVYFLISTVSGVAGTSILKAILDVIAILVVAGGILAYYWIDEHKTKSGR